MQDDAIVISDVGSHKAWIGRNLPVYTPGTCIISNGFASMGIAVPGAIAARLARPFSQVVAITGDGGFLMNSQELETAHRLGLGFTIIIVNDNNYGLITWKQQSHTGTSHGTIIGNPDFVAYARSFGVQAHHPRSPAEIRETLTQCLTSSQLHVVVIDIDPKVNGDLTNHLRQKLF
jgi:acetolactate synthase-1/2/3 large subunit